LTPPTSHCQPSVLRGTQGKRAGEGRSPNTETALQVLQVLFEALSSVVGAARREPRPRTRTMTRTRVASPTRHRAHSLDGNATVFSVKAQTTFVLTFVIHYTRPCTSVRLDLRSRRTARRAHQRDKRRTGASAAQQPTRERQPYVTHHSQPASLTSLPLARTLSRTFSSLEYKHAAAAIVQPMPIGSRAAPQPRSPTSASHPLEVRCLPQYALPRASPDSARSPLHPTKGALIWGWARQMSWR
jgi:hypothetical protein